MVNIAILSHIIIYYHTLWKIKAMLQTTREYHETGPRDPPNLWTSMENHRKLWTGPTPWTIGISSEFSHENSMVMFHRFL